MNIAPPTSPANTPPYCPRCSRETEEERLARYSAGLKRLAEMGLDFAGWLHREGQTLAVEAQARAAEAQARAAEAQARAAEAQTPPPETPAPSEARSGAAAKDASKPPPARPSFTQLGLAYDRVSRTIHFCYMLEEKLTAAFAKRAREAAKEAVEQAAQKEEKRRNTTRRTVDRVVKEAIVAEAGDQSERNHLLGRLRLRLDQDDIYWDLATKPAEILIARLFRDLELAPDWERWRGEEWLNGDDYKALSEASSPPPCPICGRAPAPVPAAESETRSATTGTDPP